MRTVMLTTMILIRTIRAGNSNTTTDNNDSTKNKNTVNNTNNSNNHNSSNDHNSVTVLKNSHAEGSKVKGFL